MIRKKLRLLYVFYIIKRKIILTHGGNVMGEITVRKIEYKGWKNCIEITNGIIDLVATTDVGPRVIRMGFVGKENEFVEFLEDIGTTGAEEYKFYGGHRLWHAPEDPVRTYELDNSKVTYRKKKYGIVLIQDTEPNAHIKKEMEISMDPDSARVTILHRLTNKGLWEVELAPWAISMMAPGGVEIVPLNTRETGLLPNGSITLWPYTRLNDKRVSWGEKYIMLAQDVKAETAFKIGMPNESGWAAYANHGHLIVVQHDHEDGFDYPDGNCSYETYTNHKMLEMETLGPVCLLAPDETVEHIETWSLYDNIARPKNEKDIESIIVPLIGK